MKIFGLSFGSPAATTESPHGRSRRLHGSISFWTARAQEANDSHDVDATIEHLRNALEAARTLRHHQTGQVA